MKAEEILDGNIEIAVFDGYKKFKDGLGVTVYRKAGCLDIRPTDLDYQEHWELLMSLAEKICRLKIGDGIRDIDYPYLRTFGMLNTETGKIMVRFNGFAVHEADTLREATWLAVVDFVKWYNQNEKDGK